MSRATTVVTVFSLLVGGALQAQSQKSLNRSYLGKQLPDFKTQKETQKGTQKETRNGHWINAPQNMSLKHVHGRPTLICYTYLA